MVAYKEKMAAYKLTPEFAAAKLAKKSKKAGKKPKDPNAPKRPMSGYFLFGNSVREQVQEELGTKDFKQVAGRINEMWAEADQTEFKAQADAARTEYKKQGTACFCHFKLCFELENTSKLRSTLNTNNAWQSGSRNPERPPQQPARS